MFFGIEAVTRSYSVKKLFLKITEKSHENACASFLFLQLY